MRVVWQLCGKDIDDFNRLIKMNSYGDDNLIGVPRDVEGFGQEEITIAFKKFGMIYTDEEKTGALYRERRLDQVVFLQRSFRKDDMMDRWVDPLKLQSIIEGLYWFRSPADELMEMKEVFENAVRELAMHGPEIYEKYIRILEKACRQQYGEIILFKPYKSVVQAMIEEEALGSVRQLQCNDSFFEIATGEMDERAFRPGEQVAVSEEMEHDILETLLPDLVEGVPWRKQLLDICTQSPTSELTAILNSLKICHCPCENPLFEDPTFRGRWINVPYLTFIEEVNETDESDSDEEGDNGGFPDGIVWIDDDSEDDPGYSSCDSDENLD
jgi:hypothetical protein